MKKSVYTDIKSLEVWQQFTQKYALSQMQQEQFLHYLQIVLEQSELFNLTAIKNPADIIAYHFQDSLALADSYPLRNIHAIADVGSGAGFPGIPLKILFPHLHLTLIEVSRKKIAFLTMVIEKLTLEKSEVCDMDWRTFLRKTDEPIDLFVSRASLHTDELMRMFKPSCPYNRSELVYWASADWQPSKSDAPFLKKEVEYRIKNKKRRLITFARQ